MDVLPTDVLCVIASHVATQARSVGDVLRLGRLSRRWRVAVEERAIVWRSWGGLEAARRAAAIERAWAAPPPPGVPVDMPISAYHGPLPADDDDDNGGDWAESVRLATNGRFALRLARVGEARVLVLERSGIELATWTLTGDFELAEACIASQGHTVAWISHRAGQASRVLSCAKVGRAAPFNVTVFRTRPMHGRYWKASVSSPNLVAITDGGHFLTRHGYELIRFDELGNNDHSCTLPRCRDVVYLTGTLIAANDDDCGNVMVYDFSACRRVHPHDMSGPQTYNLPKLQVVRVGGRAYIVQVDEYAGVGVTISRMVDGKLVMVHDVRLRASSEARRWQSPKVRFARDASAIFVQQRVINMCRDGDGDKE